MRSIPRILIAGTTSGVGKTTITAGLIASLTARGLRVQPYKCGPDYIDPSYHSLAAGRPCRNLDSWMLPRSAMLEVFSRACQDVDVAVIEGVMGLYDGHGDLDDEGSSAEIARLLNVPVILVADVGKVASSAAAMILGYQQFDPRVRIAGAILNRVGSPSHLRWIQEPLERKVKVPVVGHLPKNAQLHLPERHLGLIPAAESVTLAESLARIRSQVEVTVDVDAILAIARGAGPLRTQDAPCLFPGTDVETRATIAVARDEAFSFYYQDNLDLLTAWGARIVPVSPLRDRGLPPEADGLYIGGGFPELYAADLADNTSFLSSIREAAQRNMPICAECGGLMYLSQGIADKEGHRHELAGLVPGWSIMQRQRVRMGYVTAEVLRDNPLARQGERLRGHEFHWSTLEGQLAAPAYHLEGKDPRPEGHAVGNLLASYVHLHFGAHPETARRFVDACSEWRETGGSKC
ncbi:MAG: cobyrinate a,c-diamide synthase [Chloroflexota bacterium]|nr:MAG: cobyrinate a,c-diamide synthase [Chloroflexota bacterium]